MPPETDPSLFVVSPQNGHELAAVCADSGWLSTVVGQVHDAQADGAQADGAQVHDAQVHDAISALAINPARIVIVDARDGLVTGVRLIQDLARIVEERRGALLVLLSGDNADSVSAVFDAGATQVLVSPFSNDSLAMAVNFAGRTRDRLNAASTVRFVTSESEIPPKDRLTGLATSAQAHSWVELLISARNAPDPAVVVLQVAIGRFGQLNAAYGRTVADAVLRSVALRLRWLADTMSINGSIGGPAGETRLVSRLAGAEFAVILAGPTTLADAAEFARHIARSFELPFIVDGRSIHLSCRVGIAAAAPDSDAATSGAADLVLQHASVALTLARSGIPGTVEIFQAPSGAEPLRRMADLESDLRTALDAGEVDVLFQPQVDTATDRIVGAEALVRWQHPVLGQLSAETLLEVAESAEFATHLGAYIQRQALTVAAHWPPVLSGLRLAVNVTAADLATPDFIAGLDDALACSGFPADRLTIELTESDLIENLNATAEVLAMVRARGIQVSLDDFGTGYSSLAYLKALPLDCLKLDRQLVGDLGGTRRARVVVKSVVDMARALGMCVVAEGVETEPQREVVIAAGCDWYQGFLCAAPMTPAALATFVEKWHEARVAA